MNSRFIKHLQYSLIFLDLLSINLIFLVVLYSFDAGTLTASFAQYSWLELAISAAWFVTAVFTNLYVDKNVKSFELFSKRTALNYIAFLSIISPVCLFINEPAISIPFLVTVLGAIPAALGAIRYFYFVVSKYFRKKDRLISKVLVIGYNNLSKKIVGSLEEKGINKEIIGYCEETHNVKELSRYPILSNINSAFEVCKQYGANEIYSTIAPEQHPEIYKIIQKADENCIRFRIVPDTSLFINRKVRMDYLDGVPVISLRHEPLEDLSSRILKRIFDIVVSSIIILLFLSWMVPIIGMLIWLESKGPIFFLQERSGKDNKSFKCMKFRSMNVNSKANELQATKNDARITKIGRFLRRSSLDEFPQFLNVFIGNMSIVGPRPHMIRHTDQYSRLIRQYMVRQFLKPGITGWAQINGFRGETKLVEQMQKRVEYDLWYMENWTPWLDIKIIFLTVYNTIRGEQMAY